MGMLRGSVQTKSGDQTMSKTKSFAAILLLLIAAPVLAAHQIVGQDAPDFNAAGCLFEPEATTLEQCSAEVVLIKFWGMR
jgi:hypothetical protein